jgi:hypothetical protein
LIRDHADRDAIAMQLLRYPDENGQGWADIIDFLTMHPDVRRQIVRLIAEFSTGEAQTDVDTMSREVQVSRTRRTANAG